MGEQDDFATDPRLTLALTIVAIVLAATGPLLRDLVLFLWSRRPARADAQKRRVVLSAPYSNIPHASTGVTPLSRRERSAFLGAVVVGAVIILATRILESFPNFGSYQFLPMSLILGYFWVAVIVAIVAYWGFELHPNSRHWLLMTLLLVLSCVSLLSRGQEWNPILRVHLPIELAHQIVTVLGVGSLLQLSGGLRSRTWTLNCAVLLFASVALALASPPSFLIAGIACGALLWQSHRLTSVATLALVPLVSLLLALRQPRGVERISGWVDPSAHRFDTAWQRFEGLRILAESRPLGPARIYVDESGTPFVWAQLRDLAFAQAIPNVSYNLGQVAALLLVASLLLISWLMWKSPSMIAKSIGALSSTSIIVVLGCTIGILPQMTVALPMLGVRAGFWMWLAIFLFFATPRLASMPRSVLLRLRRWFGLTAERRSH